MAGNLSMISRDAVRFGPRPAGRRAVVGSADEDDRRAISPALSNYITDRDHVVTPRLVPGAPSGQRGLGLPNNGADEVRSDDRRHREPVGHRGTALGGDHAGREISAAARRSTGASRRSPHPVRGRRTPRDVLPLAGMFVAARPANISPGRRASGALALESAGPHQARSPASAKATSADPYVPLGESVSVACQAPSSAAHGTVHRGSTVSPRRWNRRSADSRIASVVVSNEACTMYGEWNATSPAR